MKILIVDDNDDARVLMHKLLVGMGHNVEIAVNGLQGLDAAKRFCPDIIFTDLMMPEMDGFQLCRTVNEDANLKHIPVVIHSSTFDESEDEKVAMESGAASFIKKPILEKEFVDIVNQVISRFEKGELNNSRQRSVSDEELDTMHYRSLVNNLYKKTEALQNEIISRKNAYELLKINEDRYRSLLNNAPNVVVCMTGEHFITEFNKEAERIYGYQRADVVGKDYLELFVPEVYHENVASDIQKVLAGEPTFGYEQQVISRDGTKYDILWNITCMLNIEGKPVGIIAMGVDITTRKQAEESLYRSEERYRGIFNESIVAIYIFDIEKRFINSNQAGLDLLGYSREELLDMAIPDVDAHPEKVLPAHQQLLSGDSIVNFEHQLKRKDGKIITVLNNSLALTDTDRKVVGMQSTLIDITEHREAEKELQDELNSKKIMLDNIPCIAMILSPENNEVVACNKKGISLGLAPGKKCFEIWQDAKSPCPWCLCEETVRTGRPQISEARANEKVFELYWVPLKEDLILHYIFDITERKKTEEELEKSKNSLAEAQRIAHLGSWELDLIKNDLQWSDEIYQIFGLEPQQFGATYESFLNTVHPDDRELVNSAYNKSVKDNLPYDITHRIIRPDGEERIVHEKCEHFRDEIGNVIRSIGMVQDITERSILERAVIDFEEQERQRIGHDLHDDVGQLLTGLGFKTQGLLEKLKDINGGLYREGEEISELVEQAKNKLRHLTKGLLPVDLSNMGLVEAIEGLVSDINRLFDIKCNFNCVEPFNVKNRDSVIHLYRIVQEAATNALKHAKADKLEISLDKSENTVTMLIKDNGVGISKPELSKGGIGLKIMEYRARLINASLNIYKDIDSGAVIKCVMNDR